MSDEPAKTPLDHVADTLSHSRRSPLLQNNVEMLTTSGFVRRRAFQAQAGDEDRESDDAPGEFHDALETVITGWRKSGGLQPASEEYKASGGGMPPHARTAGLGGACCTRQCEYIARLRSDGGHEMRLIGRQCLLQ